IPLNIAEGSGKPAPADRARFYAIARGSAMECAALLDVCRVAGLVSVGEVEEGKVLVTRVVAMLTRMCRGGGEGGERGGEGARPGARGGGRETRERPSASTSAMTRTKTGD